jgi:signal transduction histidine kinase
MCSGVIRPRFGGDLGCAKISPEYNLAVTLRQKISGQVGAMLVGLLLVSGASLWGINALHEDYGVALDGYQRLRQAYGAATHLSIARKVLEWPHVQAVVTAQSEVQAAATEFEPLTAPGGGWDATAAAAVRNDLRSIAADLDKLAKSPTGTRPLPNEIDAQRDRISTQLGRIGQLSAGIRKATEAAQQAADDRRRETIGVLAALAGVVVLAAIVLGVLHYRGVMGPIRRLSRGVERLTAGQFKGRIDAKGRDELASLARDFNRMAEELDGFYHELERKVAEKSRELVRSERLASLGYLAAGVAHEINNPLGIISGYAEYSLAELERARNTPSLGTPGEGRGEGSRDDTDSDQPTSIARNPHPNPLPEYRERGLTPEIRDELAKSLRIICDEAFRCKAITRKLLSLARGGDEPRLPVSLLAVANEVGSIVGGLKEHRDKRLVVRSVGDSPAGAEVLAVEAEMKQVVLNLTVNALEAVSAGGEVEIDVARDDGSVVLTVSDDGRGMSPATLERIFEPFFTEKRADGRRGTGLGLSITHAIVQDHGGSIVAQSAGPGRGSRFVVRFPAAAAMSAEPLTNHG